MVKGMRIAVVSIHGCPEVRLGHKDTGGMNAVLLQTVTRLGKLGIKVDIFTRFHGFQSAREVILSPNVTVIHLMNTSTGLTKEEIYNQSEQFIAEIDLYKVKNNFIYDVIHVHYWLSASIGLSLAKSWTVPLVAQFHTLADAKIRSMTEVMDPPLRNVVEKNTMHQADKILAASNDEMASIEFIDRNVHTKLELVPYGVDISVFHPVNSSVARSRLGLNGHPLIVYAGRIDPIKGIDLLLQSVACMKIRENAELIVIGGGDLEFDEYLNYLHNLTQELGISQRVHFVDAMDQQLLMYYFNAADVCVVPSRYESFGLVALEAMACGTPVIARKVGGLQSLVKHGMTGYLVPWHCPEPIANQLEVILENDLLRKKMGYHAESWAKTWTWESTVEQLNNVYKEITCHSVD